MTTPDPNPADTTEDDGAEMSPDTATDIPGANPAYSTPPPEGISEADDG